MDAECQSALSRASCLTASTSAQRPLSRYIISSTLTTPLWASLLFWSLVSRRKQAYISTWRPQAEMVEPRRSDCGFWACLLRCVFYVLELCLFVPSEDLKEWAPFSPALHLIPDDLEARNLFSEIVEVLEDFNQTSWSQTILLDKMVLGGCKGMENSIRKDINNIHI